MVAPFLPEKEKVAAIRDELPATGTGIYLDAATAGPLPAATDRAMREWSDWEVRVGRASDVADDEFAGRVDEARAALAAILVAAPDDVRLAPGAAAGLIQAAARRSWRAGQRIVTVGSLEPAVRSAVDTIASLAGAEIVRVEDVDGESPASVADRAIDASGGESALVCVAHVSPATGRVAPVRELARVAHDAGGWLAVDGSLAVGAIAVGVSTLGADVYLVAGDRWLCGPSGAAAVWMAPRATTTAAEQGETSDWSAELHRAAVVGLGRSAGWLAMQVGLEWAYARTADLVGVARAALGSIDGVTLAPGPAEDIAAIITFGIRGWPVDEARDQLRRRAFALIGSTPDGDALRLGLGLWNTEEEIKSLAAAVRELAGTTPDALPPRPRIVVVGDSG
jgi:selenocysteine lyase/cysteine desulfurase